MIPADFQEFLDSENWRAEQLRRYLADYTPGDLPLLRRALITAYNAGQVVGVAKAQEAIGLHIDPTRTESKGEL